MIKLTANRFFVIEAAVVLLSAAVWAFLIGAIWPFPVMFLTASVFNVVGMIITGETGWVPWRDGPS